MKETKEIYVVLVKAHTALGRLARLFKHYEYTHVAVCMKKPFTDFITFSRRYHYNPFDCGFMHETLDCYIYGDFESVKMKVFRVPVTEEEYHNIERFIQKTEADGAILFDIFSMLTMSMCHGLSIPKAYNCMSFTGKILSMISAGNMTGRSNSYDIRQMDTLLTPFFYQEGRVHKRGTHRPDYMQHIPFHKKLGDGAKLFLHLFTRWIG